MVSSATFQLGVHVTLLSCQGKPCWSTFFAHNSHCATRIKARRDNSKSFSCNARLPSRCTVHLCTVHLLYTTAYSTFNLFMLATGMQVPVYNQERRTDTFIYTTGMSALDEFSVCFWMKGVEDDDDWKTDALISIATPGKLTE